VSSPGWGRSTLLTHAASFLNESEPSANVRWTRHRAEAARLLATLTSTDVLLIDDVLKDADDGLWQIIDRALRRGGGRVIVSSPTHPPADLAADSVVIDERALGFDIHETRDLLALNGVQASPETIAQLHAGTRGCVMLLKPMIERGRSDPESLTWLSPDTPLAHDMATQYLGVDPPDDPVCNLLNRARGHRRFSAAVVPADSTESLAFDRLAASPLGTMARDEFTGETVFEWSTSTWRFLTTFDRARHRRDLERALGMQTTPGARGTRLFTLLALDRFSEAQRLTRDHLRLFLLATPATTADALFARALSELAPYPDLLLLATELRVRKTGRPDAGRQGALLAAEALNAELPDSGWDAYRLATRRAFALVSAGDRQGALSALESALELLGTPGNGILAMTTSNAAVASRLAAELYLPFWTAIQTDRHDAALYIAELMRAYANPDSLTAIAETFTSLTERAFAGSPMSPADMDLSHADAVRRLDEGDDDAAAAAIHMLTSRSFGQATRSAADALILLIRAIVEPTAPSEADVDQVVQLSVNFWTDGRPSTFLLAAAVASDLAGGRISRAQRRLLTADQTDWFISAARALLALATNRPSEALEELRTARRLCNAPRAAAFVQVLVATAECRIEQTAAASEVLSQLLGGPLAPFTRFALRFISNTDLDALIACAPPATAALLRESSRDRKLIRHTSPPSLTRVEIEMLWFLRAGRSDQEIANARVVSLNTVSTQRRLLFRKLAVTRRADAVSTAERLGVFDS
jgi:DNA-binding CsgD family transcriptional regulator/tetratricopeptide (TPR) repeat protein